VFTLTKQTQNVDNLGQADASSEEADITAAMVDAGMSALFAVAGISDGTDPIETVIEVFLAMDHAKLRGVVSDNQYLKEQTLEVLKRVHQGGLNVHQ
jgi:hypothetical protein